MQNGLSEQDYMAQKRLEKLEGMIRHISSAIGINAESASVADFELGTTKALKGLQHQTEPASNQNSRLAGRNSSLSSGPSQPDSLAASADANHSFEQAPLLDLFKSTMIIETDNSQPDRIQRDMPADQAIRSCIISLNALRPTDGVLTSILNATEKFWPLWRPFPERVFNVAMDGQNHPVVLAKNFILESFSSGDPVSIARAVLCLALCIQQIPAKSQELQNLPCSANVVLESYLSSVETLLSFEPSMRTLDGVECWALLAKLYINAGRPRKTWLSCRRAMNYALIMGLNRPSGQTDEHRRAIWTSIWQTECCMALVTGVPFEIAQSHASLFKEYHNQSIIQRVMLRISIADIYINERNQDPQSASHSTSEIEAELRQCRDEMPSEWWDDASHDLSLQELYSIVGIKLRYLEAVKFLHLPYMFRPCPFGDQQRSKTAGLNAAREMIHCYQHFRRLCGTTFVMCDFIDFVVFTGTVLLIINLLGQLSSGKSNQDISDWKLVTEVSKTLDYVSRELECSVAGQAAQLLDYLSSSYQGSYSGPEVYEAVIPYFGKIRIRQAKRAAASNSTTLSSPENPPTPSSLNSLEFSIGQIPTGESWADEEIGIDWTSVLDADTTTYDWNYVFNNVGSS